MAYRLYIDHLLMPVAPEKVITRISNRNETVSLINDTEINITRAPGLTEIETEVLLPAEKMPFAKYTNDKFVPIREFLDKFEKLKVKKIAFPLMLARLHGGPRKLPNSRMKVTLEEYEIIDDAANGVDTLVSLRFKEYVDYGTQQAKIVLPSSYTTKKGDTLVKIAKLYYGKSGHWKKIYEANKKKVKKKDKKSLKAGIKLKIPE